MVASVLSSYQPASSQRMPSFSRSLEKALHQALAYAETRRQRHSTIEHFLLALLGDQDCVDALIACDCDLALLRGELSNYIDNELHESTEVDFSVENVESKPNKEFQRVIQRAVIQVQSSGGDEITGANALVAMIFERNSQAKKLLDEQGINRYDLVNYLSHGIRKTNDDEEESIYFENAIEKPLNRSAKNAPRFEIFRNRIVFRQASPDEGFDERRSVVYDRLKGLFALCSRRENELPNLKNLVDRYRAALDLLAMDRGLYSLFVAGIEIEFYLKVKAEAPADLERNPPLDADVLFSVQSLIVAHAGLMAVFADARRMAHELDTYRELSESVDAFRERILDPVISHLAASEGVFDEATLDATVALSEARDVEGDVPSKGISAAKHGWLRGALAAVGHYVLRQAREISKVARDAMTKEVVRQLFKKPDKLLTSILRLLTDSKEELILLAEKLPHAFGWVAMFVKYLGLR